MLKINRGFTLVEVMVAVAIIGIALPSLLVVMMGHIDGSAWLRDKLQAQWVADNRIAEIRLQHRRLGEIDIDEQSGHEELAGRRWHWRSRAKAFEQEEFNDIYGIEVSVWLDEPKSQEDKPLITVVGIIHRHAIEPIKRAEPEKPASQSPQDAAEDRGERRGSNRARRGNAEE